MRIVQMVENLDRGGLERMALDLAKAQQALGHQVSIYCLHGRGALAGEAEQAGIAVTAFEKKPGFSLGLFWRLRQALRRDRAEAVHTHNPGSHHYAAIAARLAGARVMLSTRHSPVDSQGRPYQERYFRWVQRWTDAIVHVCDNTRRLLVERAGLSSAKSLVVYNGIVLDPYRAESAQPGAAAPRLRFGTVGRMVPAKAHSILLDAFAQVRAVRPGAELWLGGYGPLEEQLRAQAARLGLTEAVRFERVSAESGPRFYSSLDVFVLSSVNEGLPLVILEAMAAGLPVISTRVGGVPEVAPEHTVAWYCAPGSAAELGEAMLAAASDPAELARRGSAARALALSRYGVEHMAAGYDAIINRTAGR